MGIQPKAQKSYPKADDSFIREPEGALPLEKKNFLGMIATGVLIVLGFILMLGAPSGADSFNADIFSTRRIVVGPFLAFIGFIAMGAAIIIRPKNRKSE